MKLQIEMYLSLPCRRHLPMVVSLLVPLNSMHIAEGETINPPTTRLSEWREINLGH